MSARWEYASKRGAELSNAPISAKQLTARLLCSFQVEDENELSDQSSNIPAL